MQYLPSESSVSLGSLQCVVCDLWLRGLEREERRGGEKGGEKGGEGEERGRKVWRGNS